MTHEPTSEELPPPSSKRRQNTARRLRAALQRLVAGTPNHPALRGRPYRLSVATLAREARISRNTIYANHRSILDELDRAAERVTTTARSARDPKAAELVALIEQLRRQKQQLATENAALLKRAMDAEKIVAQLKKQNARLVGERTAACQPIALPGQRS